MSISETFKKLREQRAEMEKKFQEVAAAAFHEEVAGIFEKFPALQSFGWYQYTPYFNDGDTCTFRANTDDFLIEWDGEEKSVDEDDEEERISAWSIRHCMKNGKTWNDQPFSPSEKDHAVLALADFMQQFDDDILLVMFGDHAEVTVRRDGTVDIGEYSHE